jgi:hypothetical protein
MDKIKYTKKPAQTNELAFDYFLFSLEISRRASSK